MPAVGVPGAGMPQVSGWRAASTTSPIAPWTVRHEIARIYTVMRERELGLSSSPDAVSTGEGAA